MSTQPTMTFEEWWETVFLKMRVTDGDNEHGHHFMLAVEKLAAEKGWEAGQMVLREHMARIMRDVETSRRRNAKRFG